MTRLKLFLRIIKAIAELSQELRELRETLMATTILLNTKPLGLEKIMQMDKRKVSSPLLYDLLSSMQDHQLTEITDYKTPEEQALDAEAATIMEARRQFEESRFRAWRDPGDTKSMQGGTML